jgi:hypothetical protein
MSPHYVMLYTKVPLRAAKKMRLGVLVDNYSVRTYTSRATWSDIARAIKDATEAMDALGKKSIEYHQYLRESRELISESSAILADMIISDELNAVLANFSGTGHVMCIQDRKLADVPWEMLRLTGEHGSRLLGDSFIVSRVSEQDKQVVNNIKRQLDKQKADVLVGKSVTDQQWWSGLSDRVKTQGLRQVNTKAELKTIVADRHAFALIAQGASKGTAVSIVIDADHKIGGEWFITHPLAPGTIACLIVCKAEAGSIARTVVRKSDATVIASPYVLRAETGFRLVRILARRLRKIDTEIEIAELIHTTLKSMGLHGALFRIYGTWDGTIE